MRNVITGLGATMLLSGLGYAGIAAAQDIASFNAIAIPSLSVVNGINDSGEVVGKIPATLTSDGREHAAHWSQGGMTDLGIIGCRETVSVCWSMAWDINNNGIVAGESFTAYSWPSMYNWPWAVAYPHDVIWSSINSNPQHIRSLGHEYAHALDINETGQMVGWARSMDWYNVSGDRYIHGYVWYNNNQYYEIGSYGQYSKAFALNDAVQATGEIKVGGYNQAFLWQNATTTVIGHLGGNISSGKDITNDASPKIVGVSKNGSGYDRAFLWQGGSMSDLGTLGTATTSAATAINDAGVIVGASGGKAVIWQTGQIADINTMLNQSIGTTLVNAVTMNESSQIVAKASNGVFYLLTPVY